MPKLKNLVLSGGGTNAIGFLGVFKYLIEKDLFNEINHYVGTSAGSIFSFLLNIGYTYNELNEFCCNFPFNKIVENINLNNFFNKFGLEDSSKLYYILKRLCENKKYDSKITFLELFERTNVKLTVTGTCLSNSKLYYFNYETYPDMEVLMAVRISSCIPFIFAPIVFDNRLWLDGGIVCNNPINYCSNEIENTLSISIYDNCLDNCPNNTPTDFLDYIINVIKCICLSETTEKINLYEKNTIKYSYSNELISDFNISKETINDMINYGYETTEDQKDVILQFCDLDVTQNSNSESISKSESDAILKLIDDVDNSLNNYSDTLIDSEESNSNSNCSSNIINLIRKETDSN